MTSIESASAQSGFHAIIGMAKKAHDHPKRSVVAALVASTILIGLLCSNTLSMRFTGSSKPKGRIWEGTEAKMNEHAQSQWRHSRINQVDFERWQPKTLENAVARSRNDLLFTEFAALWNNSEQASTS